MDCEYNRSAESIDGPRAPKKLDTLNLSPTVDDTDGDTVFPDIVVHRRRKADNYLVIEVKKTTSVSRKDDRNKLRCYQSDPTLKYANALFLVLETGINPDVKLAEWVEASATISTRKKKVGLSCFGRAWPRTVVSRLPRTLDGTKNIGGFYDYL